MMEFYNESRHKSRKARICECCGKTIQVGETYTNQRGKYAGEFFTRDLCDLCEAVLYSYCSEVDTEFSWLEVREHAQSCVCWSCPKYADDECDTRVMECPRVRQHFCAEVKA